MSEGLWMEGLVWGTGNRLGEVAHGVRVVGWLGTGQDW